MAVDGLKWVMELLDRTSGPARKVAAALSAVSAAQDSVRASATKAASAKSPLDSIERGIRRRRGAREAVFGRELADLARQQGQASGSSSAFSSVLGGVGSALMVAGAAAVAAAAAIGGVGASAARSTVELAGFQESTMVAMQTMLGSRSAANAEFSRSLSIARLTPFDTRNVVSMRRQLVGAGFRDSAERDVMTGVLADLSALNPEDSTVMQRLGLAVGQIRGAGRLRGQELNQLVQAGLSRDALFQEVGAAMNLRGAPVAVNRQVAALMEQGRITDRIAFAALARATMRMTNTTQVGQFSANQSGTITGLLSTLGSAVPELLLGQDASGTRLFESAGMASFKSFLKQVVELLSSTSATGQRLQRIMRGVVDEVFGLFADDKTKKGGLNVVAIFTRMLDAIESTIGATRTLVKWTAELGGGAWSVLGAALEQVGGAASWVMKQMGGAEAQTALAVFRFIGQAIGVIVIALYAMLAVVALPFIIAGAALYGLVTLFGMLIDKIRELAAGAPDWLKNLFGSDAPQPALSGATPIVDSARNPAAGRAVVSQPNVTVNVNALTDGSSPQDIAGAAASMIPGIVQTAAERAGAGAAA
jgi:hypothetical protein